MHALVLLCKLICWQPHKTESVICTKMFDCVDTHISIVTILLLSLSLRPVHTTGLVLYILLSQLARSQLSSDLVFFTLMCTVYINWLQQVLCTCIHICPIANYIHVCRATILTKQQRKQQQQQKQFKCEFYNTK